MPEPSAAPGDRLIRAGMVVTAVGMAAHPGRHAAPGDRRRAAAAFWWLSMLVGVGLAMVLVGLARNGRRRSRSQTAARAALD